jgi:hypothetical protein
MWNGNPLSFSISTFVSVLWASSSLAGPPERSAPICDLTVRATSGMPAPGQGQLLLSTFNPATINESGQVAFYSKVNGSSRNQGVFMADAGGLHAIAVGCGGPGGSGHPASCGDPSPIGGTFSGLFGGSFFTPDINGNGDVLFYADVTGGSSERGLFLRKAATQQIVKVAVVGDPSPLGGLLRTIGPGTLNDAAKVAFLASSGTESGADVNVFLWDDGTITTVAHVGQTIPGGGVVTVLGSEWLTFGDGTSIAVGRLPDINDQGDIAYRAIFGSGRGLVVTSGGDSQVVVHADEPTPIGGTYLDFFEPILNHNGQMAFLADVQLSPGTFDSAWFVGTAGNWRKALRFFDEVDGGMVYGLAVSRNPMQPLDDEGNLMLWCSLDPDGVEERLLMVRADGTVAVLAKPGDPTPAGLITSIQPWPSTADCHRLLSANTGHMTFQALPGAIEKLVATRPSAGSDEIEVSWDQGVLCPSESFDVARGTLGGLHGSGLPADAVCAADGLAEALYAEPPEGCPTISGDGCWYLVRDENLCGPGRWGPVALDAASPCP